MTTEPTIKRLSTDQLLGLLQKYAEAHTVFLLGIFRQEIGGKQVYSLGLRCDDKPAGVRFVVDGFTLDDMVGVVGRRFKQYGRLSDLERGIIAHGLEQDGYVAMVVANNHMSKILRQNIERLVAS